MTYCRNTGCCHWQPASFSQKKASFQSRYLAPGLNADNLTIKISIPYGLGDMLALDFL